MLYYYEELVKSFNMGFLLNDYLENDNGATGLITPNQYIFVMNRSDRIGSIYHQRTRDNITRAIYDIPKDNSDKDMNKFLLEIENYQNIFIRMINEHGVKAIFILFLPAVHPNQVRLLEQIEEEYGEFLKSIGNNMSVGFVKENSKLSLSSSFDKAIEYARSIATNKDCAYEHHIIGTSLNQQNIL